MLQKLQFANICYWGKVPELLFHTDISRAAHLLFIFRNCEETRMRTHPNLWSKRFHALSNNLWYNVWRAALCSSIKCHCGTFVKCYRENLMKRNVTSSLNILWRGNELDRDANVLIIWYEKCIRVRDWRIETRKRKEVTYNKEHEAALNVNVYYTYQSRELNLIHIPTS